jgi:hypothetical protein
MGMPTVRRIGAVSWAKILGVIYTLIGLFVGAIFALVSLFGIALGNAFSTAGGSDAGRFLPALFGVGAIIFFPILYGLLGFIAGLVGAGLYNLAAGMVGGVEIELT